MGETRPTCIQRQKCNAVMLRGGRGVKPNHLAADKLSPTSPSRQGIKENTKQMPGVKFNSLLCNNTTESESLKHGSMGWFPLHFLLVLVDILVCFSGSLLLVLVEISIASLVHCCCYS